MFWLGWDRPKLLPDNTCGSHSQNNLFFSMETGRGSESSTETARTRWWGVSHAHLESFCFQETMFCAL